MFGISIIIVNYNTADLLATCLNSVEPWSDLGLEVIVVDNASQDDSAAMVIQDFPWVKLIANECNAGFAQANNQALKV